MLVASSPLLHASAEVVFRWQMCVEVNAGDVGVHVFMYVNDCTIIRMELES